MADTPAGNNPQNPIDPQNMPQMRIITQYVKDLSFENPGAPESMRADKGQPKIELNFDIQGAKLENDVHEITLGITAHAKREDETVFICELAYAGLFELKNFDEQSLQPMVMIECPRLIFPFARRVFADATRDGGFPPLMLEPLDFAGLYRQQLAQQQAAAAQNGSEGGDAPVQ